MAELKLETFELPVIRFRWLLGSKIKTMVKYKDAWFHQRQFPTVQQFDVIRNFPLDNSDILITSFFRSGSIKISSDS